MEQFELEPLAKLPSGQLPGGYKQRLAMAAALLHEPEILFLDEPTSGADPLARREFWRRITALAEQGVTVIVTTHFMEEAEYCDRVVILDAGQVLAEGTPAEIRARAPAERGARADDGGRLHRHRRGGAARARPPGREGARHERHRPRPPRAAATAAPFRQAARRVCALDRQGEPPDPARPESSIALGIVMPVMLILLFGYALSLDVRNAPVALVIEQPSAMASEVAAGFRLSPYFDAQTVTSMAEAEKLMRAHEVDGIVHLRGDFARDVAAGDAEVQVLLHGTDANTARIIQGYALGAIGMAGAAARGGRQPGRRHRPGQRARAASGSTRPTTATISSCPA